ncbi:MAG: FtsW/RodA/SpoVE family cell cycle protein, partial [Chryseobacterium sp.]
MKEQFTETKTEYLKGDKVLWIVIILISMLSVFPVYSASSNLEYIVNNGTTTGHVVKHIAFVFAGLIIMRSMAAFRIEKLGAFSILALFGTVLLLLLTFSSGQEIGGASASRWL